MLDKTDCVSIASIEMPEEVIEAASNDKLVVFAGAGVSMQLPEPLDDFKHLTNELFKDIDKMAEYLRHS